MNSPPRPKLDWRKVQSEYFSDDHDTAGLLETSLQNPEDFVPKAIYSFEPNDILTIQKMKTELYDEARRLPYFHYYLRLLAKIQVLIAEQFPDDFGRFSQQTKTGLIRLKCFYPTEKSVRGIFNVLTGKVDPGTARSAYTFCDKVNQLLAAQEHKPLCRNLEKVYFQYKEYVEENPDP